ncbi:recombinase family protein [Streptomyces sp. NPDC002067]
MTPRLRPLAYIYDRSASLSSRHLLEQRLTGCHITADRYEWDIAGVWADRGLDALADFPFERPAFQRLVRQMKSDVAPQRTLVCLVHSWDRLTTARPALPAFQRHIQGAGGCVATTFGESDARFEAILPAGVNR